MELNNNELAAVKDCLKNWCSFENYGLMSNYKVRQSNLLLLDNHDINIDRKNRVITKNNKIIYKLKIKHSMKTYKMLLPELIEVNENEVLLND